jgi:hypothetical protein
MRHLNFIAAAALTSCAPAPSQSVPPAAGPCAVHETSPSGTIVLERTRYVDGRPRHRAGFSPDGTIWRSWSWSYADRAVRVRSREHTEGASVLDWTRTQHLDTRDRWVIEELDRHSDGVIDETRTRTFQDDQLVGESRSRQGEPLSQTTHTRWPGGRQETLVAWADGGSDLVVRTYDADDRLVAQRTDLGIDGVWDDVRTTTWDARGRRAWHEDHDADGRPELSGRRRDDGCGYREEEDLDGDEVPDRIWTYNCEGNLSELSLPSDRRTLQYSYSCP